MNLNSSNYEKGGFICCMAFHAFTLLKQKFRSDPHLYHHPAAGTFYRAAAPAYHEPRVDRRGVGLSERRLCPSAGILDGSGKRPYLGQRGMGKESRWKQLLAAGILETHPACRRPAMDSRALL